MTQNSPPERSIDEIIADSKCWCAIANELFHRDGPASYIELEFGVASDSARSYPQTYWDSCIAPNIKSAENEAAKYRNRSDVVQALIKGYQKLIASYKESRSYFYAKLRSDEGDDSWGDMAWFDRRIGSHTERIQQLKKILKQEK